MPCALLISPPRRGDASIEIFTDDLGNTALGTPLTDEDTLEITVTPVNDALENTVPEAQFTDEDVPLHFSHFTGNGISVADGPLGVNPIEVTLTATHGVLTLSGVAGLTFSEGDGTRSITHVGVSLGGWTMIHSWRGNNGVYVDDLQTQKSLMDNFVGAGSFLRTA